jgi:hypothetical protein
VDRWDLTELIQNDPAPSTKEIARRINEAPEHLPKGVPADYLADAIFNSLSASTTPPASGAAPPLTDGDTQSLDAIPAGKKAASKYEGFVERVLTHVLADQLELIRSQLPQNNGRKRIDIGYRNKAREGFFFELHTKHQIACGIVPVECKNYTGDLGNPEFDQLAGRLSGKLGQFGILVCRANADRDAAAARALDYADKHKKFILVLGDDDLKLMIGLYLAGDLDGVDDLLHRHLRPLLLD